MARASACSEASGRRGGDEVTLWTGIKAALGVRGLGYREDKPDDRDRHFLEMPLGVSTPPPSASLEHFIPRVLDQGPTQGCVGYSWAAALSIEMRSDGWETVFEPSPLAIYYWARAFSGLQTVDGGSFLRDAPRALERFGFPAEAAWPSVHRKVQVAPGIDAFRSAADRRRLGGYYRIARGDTGAVRLAIAAGRPVVFGLQVGRSFLDGRERIVDRDEGDAKGGHAMVAVGYDSDRFRILSSWGTAWRDQGLCWMTERRLREGIDLWVCDLRSP